MNPKKPSYFHKLTAEQLNVSEELVKDIVNMYWGDVRKALTELKHHSVYVIGLGTFKIKFWKLDDVKKEYGIILADNNCNSFRKMAVKNELEDRIIKINKLQEMLADNVQKKQLKREIRYGKSNPNLEKQISDNGGGDELNPEEGSGRSSLPEENEDM